MADGPFRTPTLTGGGKALATEAGWRASLRQQAVFLGYRSASLIARRVPGSVGAAHLAGAFFATTMTGRRAMMGRHLRRVVGPHLEGMALEAAVNRAFLSYARSWRESFRLPELSSEELEAHMSFTGFEHLVAALARRRGLILALPHLGTWDYGGAWMAAVGYPMTVVVEPLPGDELFEWFSELRRSIGLTVVPLGPRATATLIATLRAGGIVGLISDRDITRRGLPVRFFGEQTTLPAGPATLALRTGAALVPVAVYDDPGGRHRAVIRPPLDVRRTDGPLSGDVSRITQALAGEMEELIRQAPEQWHLFQPNWPSDYERAR